MNSHGIIIAARGVTPAIRQTGGRERKKEGAAEWRSRCTWENRLLEIGRCLIWRFGALARSPARPLTRCFVRVCVCVLMLAEWDKGGRRCSGGQAKTKADPRLLNLNGNSYRIYSLSTPSPFPSRLPLWLKITLGAGGVHQAKKVILYID